MLSTKIYEPFMKSFTCLWVFCLALSLSGCYRMPDEYDYSTIPVTNNPNITKEKSSGGMPGMKY